MWKLGCYVPARLGDLMKKFWRKNRFLLIAFAVLILIITAQRPLSLLQFVPLRSTQVEIDPSFKFDAKLWIVARERYGISLWIGKPKELDQRTFNRLTGCPDLTNLAKGPSGPGVTIPFKWIVTSSSEDVVAQSNTPSITPPGNACSSAAGGRLFSLGALSLDPGIYHFKFQFTREIPELTTFPARLHVSCCEKHSYTWASAVLSIIGYIVPLLLLLAVLLALILLVRAGTALYVARASRSSQIGSP